MSSSAGRDLDRRLLNGEVQLAFMDAYGAQGFDWIPLFSSPLVAVFPKDDDRDTDKPVDIHELFGETFISSPEQYVELIFPEVTSHKRLMIDASDDATIISMVASGLGVSVALGAFAAGLRAERQDRTAQDSGRLRAGHCDPLGKEPDTGRKVVRILCQKAEILKNNQV